MTLSPEVLSGLRERLAVSTGPDREIDADIFIALSGEVPIDAGRIDRLGGMVGWWPLDSHYESAREVPRYSGSIDAALALVARLLPALCPGVSQSVFHLTWTAWLGDQREGAAFIVADASHDTSAPLAILLALLTALQENTK